MENFAKFTSSTSAYDMRLQNISACVVCTAWRLAVHVVYLLPTVYGF